MPRKYQRKTNRTPTPKDVLERAAQKCAEGGKYKTVAQEHNIDRMTLKRFCKRYQHGAETLTGYEKLARTKCVFSEEQENDLASHVVALADRCYGLSTDKARSLAFEFAKQNNISCPKNWLGEEKAGKDWFLLFRQRHNLAILQPEATSLARATAFNRYVINKFYDNLAKVMDKHKFSAQDIYNLDESGCHTVQSPGGVVTRRGRKQLGSITSRERRELVTVVYAVSATGNVIPPMFIFPRVLHVREHMLNMAPHGAVAAANKSGWITEEIFPKYLQHFVNNTRCTKEKPVLLVTDNHETHMSLESIDFAKENGIVLLTIPPHTSHKMQPLDKTVHGPFKKAYSQSMDAWMRSYEGRTVSITEVPHFVKEAQTAAMTISNITSGFESTGIFPFNRNLFTDLDFAPSDVTDRPDPALTPADHSQGDDSEVVQNAPSEAIPPEGNEQGEMQAKIINSPAPGTSADRSPGYVSPADIVPFPKAAPCKQTRRGRRKKGATRILTGTPVQNEIAAAVEAQKSKVGKKAGESTTEQEANQQTTEKTASKSRKRLVQDMLDSSDEEEKFGMSLIDNGDDSYEEREDIVEGDFLIAKGDGSKQQDSERASPNLRLSRMSTSASSSLPLGSEGAIRYKKRKANFTFCEVHILLDEVRKNRHIVVGKFNSGIPSDLKRRKWTEITQRINEIGECDREVGEVIKKWSDLKCDTKRKISALHSGAALPHSSELTQTESIVGSILELDKKPWEAARSLRGRSRSEDQDTGAGDEDDDVAVMGPGSVQDSPRSGIEMKPMAPPPAGAAAGGTEVKFDPLTTTDADSRGMDSDDDHHDTFPSSLNNSYIEDDGNHSNTAHVSSSSTGQAQLSAESEGTREQLAQSASLSVQEQHVTNALLGTVSRSLELLAESVQQLAETQQEFSRESLRLQRETVQVLREFASGALTILHERVNGKPPLI